MGSAVTLATILRSTANSAGAVKDKANRIVAASKGTSAERTSQLTGDSIKTLQDEINTLRFLLGGLATIVQSGGSSASFSITLQDVPLVTATTTNIVPVNTSPADGDALLVVTTQDATGGGLITWDASFKGVTPDDNDPLTPSVSSSYLFIGRGGFWTIAAFPRIGFAP